MAGIVTAVYVKEGIAVKKGQFLPNSTHRSQTVARSKPNWHQRWGMYMKTGRSVGKRKLVAKCGTQAKPRKNRWNSALMANKRTVEDGEK